MGYRDYVFKATSAKRRCHHKLRSLPRRAVCNHHRRRVEKLAHYQNGPSTWDYCAISYQSVKALDTQKLPLVAHAVRRSHSSVSEELQSLVLYN